MDRGGRSIGEVYSMRLALCEPYDQAGFRGDHNAEHHATSLGMSPSPGIFLAAVAQKTRLLRFGPVAGIRPATDCYRSEWKLVHGEAPLPMMGLTRHLHVADTDAEAAAVARQA